MMENLADIKHSHNIVDVISQYLTLKKSGKDYFACCPFHSEKSPSFTVDEKKQFYHCFGCGAHGDVIKFLTEYSGLDFVDACKSLGADAELMPSEKVLRNIKAAKNAPRFSTPVDDKRDYDLCAKMISTMTKKDAEYLMYINNDGEIFTPLIDWSGEVVNFFDGFDFIAGGISYGAFTPIRKKQNNNFMLCVDTKDALTIANKYNVNVLICYTAHNLKYVYKSNNSKAKLLPVVRDCDDDYLCYECEWLSFKCGELKKEKMIDV